MTNTTTAPLTVSFTSAYTSKGAPTYFRLGQIIPAGTTLLTSDETFVTTEEEYLVRGLVKNNKKAFVAAAYGK